MKFKTTVFPQLKVSKYYYSKGFQNLPSESRIIDKKKLRKVYINIKKKQVNSVWEKSQELAF